MLVPKLLTTLKAYNRKQFIDDLVAGIIVGIVALPLAIAFGIASGVSPQQGLITAVIGGFLISALGGSKVQIGGPTGAFVVIVYGIVQQYGVDGLIIATIIAGCMLIAMGLARLGTLIKFIPHPLIVGFTTGIALIIFSSQIKDFLGLKIDKVPADFIQKWVAFYQNINSVNLYSIVITLFSILVIRFWPRVSRRIPGSLITIIVSTVAVSFFALPVETIGSKFHEIPSSLPWPVFPHITYSVIKDMIRPAFTIAMLGGIESLLSAVVSDGMIGSKHRSNMELVAQGVANIFSGIFGGIPATGAIARTVTNIRNGGRTPVAGMVHAVVLLLIMMFFGKWATYIPLSCLAGVLIVVAWNMSEMDSFISILKGPRADALVLVSTFLLTVFIDLTVAIEIGMVLAAFQFMVRMSQTTNVNVFTRELMAEGEEDSSDEYHISHFNIPKGVEVYEINGPFFFGASQKFEDAAKTVENLPKVRILRLRNVPFMDSTGLHSLSLFYKKCFANNITLLLSGVQEETLKVIQSDHLYEDLGKENIIENFKEALDHAEAIINSANA